MLKPQKFASHVMESVSFDTCVYRQSGATLMAEVIDSKSIRLGSEMLGAVRGIDPTNGYYHDDTKPYIDSLGISYQERHVLFALNARRAFPRLVAPLERRGR